MSKNQVNVLRSFLWRMLKNYLKSPSIETNDQLQVTITAGTHHLRLNGLSAVDYPITRNRKIM